MSLGGIVSSESIRVGGDEMDDAVIQYMKRTYNLMVGEPTGERIKIQIGSAYPLEEEMTMVVRGRDLIAGLPRETTINSEEIRECLREPVGAIVESIKLTLERTPPELAADLMDRGIVLAGGGVLLRGMDEVVAKETGLPVHMADDPLTAVARGTGMVLDSLDKWKRYLDRGGEQG
jgi:rod shape-determining protein MreB